MSARRLSSRFRPTANAERAGFTVESTENRAAAVARPPDGERLSPQTVFGSFRRAVGNNIAGMRAGILAPVVIVARAG